jgi:hypothetical protein
MIEKFRYDQGNDCDVELKDCRIEIRNGQLNDGVIRIDLAVYDKDEKIIAKIQRFIGGK